MIEIEPARHSEVLSVLFDPNSPDHPRLFSVLAGHNPGTALVDDVANPSWCILRSGWIGRTFIAGEVDAESLAKSIEFLRRKGNIHLDNCDPHARLFPADALGEDARFAFSGRLIGVPQFELHSNALPEGCSIRPVDGELLERCLWADELLPAFGSSKQYLETSLGFCLIRENRILSEAHAFFWGEDVVEIGAITDERYRGLGYAPVAAAHLIRACEQRGYGTYWGCDVDHTSSIAVAKKLGYPDPRPYTLKVYGRLGEG